jgi:hypothetical protein
MIEHGVMNFKQVSNLLAGYSVQHQSRLVSFCVLFLICDRFFFQTPISDRFSNPLQQIYRENMKV